MASEYIPIFAEDVRLLNFYAEMNAERRPPQPHVDLMNGLLWSHFPPSLMVTVVELCQSKIKSDPSVLINFQDFVSLKLEDLKFTASRLVRARARVRDILANHSLL